MIGPVLANWATSPMTLLVGSFLGFGLIFATVCAAWRPAADFIARQEYIYDRVLRHRLLIDIKPRTVTWQAAIGTAILAGLFYLVTGSGFGALLGAAVGAVLPPVMMKAMAAKRLNRLESQLVNGLHMLASGVRAGLNLVQSMELVARDGPRPIREEFAHLLREYEYGVSLEQAMSNAARRIGSNDYELVFSALRTHRERGGNLGQTLDRIADSIREIQRLESQVRTLTAQGRATSRWLGAMPAVILALLYVMIDDEGVIRMFQDPVGKMILGAVLLLNVLGFLWIRRVMSVDI